MFKRTFKLLGLFLLLLFSFIYTDNVFKEARKTDPVMKKIKIYKRENDIKPTEPTILGDEMIIGLTGLEVDLKKSYKNMKSNDMFDDKNVIYKEKKPKINLSNTYDYYIKKGNQSTKAISIIFKVNKDSDVDNIISILRNNNLSITFFVDGLWIKKNTDKAFLMNELGCEIYNLGYDGKYEKNMIEITNNLIESITLKKSNYCLIEAKDENIKQLCKSKKMHTIIPTVINPNISELKKYIEKGNIIVYDIDLFDYSKFNLMSKIITSRGYVINKLSNTINEKLYNY